MITTGSDRIPPLAAQPRGVRRRTGSTGRLRSTLRAPLRRPLLQPCSCAIKRLGSNPGWWKPRGHIKHGLDRLKSVEPVIAQNATIALCATIIYTPDKQRKCLDESVQRKRGRSEERRVEKGRVSTFRSGWDTSHYIKTNHIYTT